MHIGVPDVRTVGRDVEYSVRYTFGSEKEQSLWYRIRTEHEEMVSPRADAALLALLIPAMKFGGDLYVEGPVTDELVHRLHHGYQDILRAVIPSLRPVRVIARHEVPAEERVNGVATGFSAGVDSFAVLADHFYAQDVPASRKITHLLFNNVGSHDEGGDADRALFLDRYDRASRIADKLLLPFVAVDSNLKDAFRGSGLDFQQTHTPRNASVAFLLQRGVGTWLYAGALPYRDIFVGETFDPSYADPVAVPILSTRSLELESHGGQYGRFGKTMRIAEISDTYWSLDVCVSGKLGVNCSECRKCLRTMATLEIGGVLERYEAVFDLDVYRRCRDDYLTLARLRPNPVEREFLVEAKRRGFPLPRASVRRISPPIYQYAKREAIRYGKNLVKTPRD
jgi:hypothetical protein